MSTPFRSHLCLWLTICVPTIAHCAEPFPVEGLLPKTEIGAIRFLEKHAKYDGRGAIVAVFDTGVDPGAAGLQQTTDGKPKIIDMVDGTGSGDVDTSAIRKAESGEIVGLTGRRLTLNPDWLANDAEFHVGIKRAFDFFPRRLIARLKRERHEVFEHQHRLVEAELRESVLSWQAAHPNATADDKLVEQDLLARVEQLEYARAKYEDPGPLYDCIVFQHEGRWRAIVDTDEDGDLTDESLLANFRDERQYGTFGDGISLNFAVNIDAHGNRLSIVVDSGEHGTHVASIIAGNHPESPEWNGVAPGAQIVSVKIGDPRLDGMESSLAIARGLAAAKRNGCDLINMSFGEQTASPDRGWLTELISKTVNEHGIVFVASAGNSGPALSSVIAPGGTTSAVIGVGAYVSPAMMAAEHGIRERLPETAYTFTSQGPTWDGDLGVDLFAPGGAIAAVPRWSEQRNQQMSGTSMAAPNAAGAIALLISAMKQESRAWTPYSLRRALQNSARTILQANKFAQGVGLIQVDRAYEQLQRNAPFDGWRFDVRVGHERRGIYLRESFETGTPREFDCSVNVVAPKTTANDDTSSFSRLLALEATERWVQVHPHMTLAHGSNRFQVTVDPIDLKTGVHFSEVLAVDSENPSAGPLFRLPITVVKPAEPNERGVTDSRIVSLAAGQIDRRFLIVPTGATWVDVRIARGDTTPDKSSYTLHAVQHYDGRSFESRHWQRHVSLMTDGECVDSFAVEDQRTLEFCIAQNWNSTTPTELRCELHFHGMVPSDPVIDLDTNGAGVWIDATATLSRETLKPAASLTTHRRSLLPIEYRLAPLDGLDDLTSDGSRLFELKLRYEFAQLARGAGTLSFPAIDDMLYESAVGSPFWTLANQAEQVVATDDGWPGQLDLQKGDYTLSLHLTSDDPQSLERLQDLPLAWNRSLKSPVAVRAFPDRLAAQRGKPTLEKQDLEAGQQRGFFLATPDERPIAAMLQPGDQLIGEIHYGVANPLAFGAGRRAGGYTIRCTIASVSKSSNRQDSTEVPAYSPSESAADDVVLEAKLTLLRSRAQQRDERGFEQITKEILAEHPDNLPVLVEQLKWLDNEANRKEHLPHVIAAADAVLAQIDSKELAAYFGTRHDPATNAEVEQHRRMTNQREVLVDTLYRKGRAIGYRELPDVVAKHPIDDQTALDESFAANFAELQRWVDTTDQQYVLLHIRAERRQQRFGNSLRLLNKYIPDSAPNYWYYKKRRDLYGELGWEHLRDAESRWLLIRFPKIPAVASSPTD